MYPQKCKQLRGKLWIKIVALNDKNKKIVVAFSQIQSWKTSVLISELLDVGGSHSHRNSRHGRKSQTCLNLIHLVESTSFVILVFFKPGSTCSSKNYPTVLWGSIWFKKFEIQSKFSTTISTASSSFMISVTENLSWILRSGWLKCFKGLFYLIVCYCHCYCP